MNYLFASSTSQRKHQQEHPASSRMSGVSLNLVVKLLLVLHLCLPLVSTQYQEEFDVLQPPQQPPPSPSPVTPQSKPQLPKSLSPSQQRNSLYSGGFGTHQQQQQQRQHQQRQNQQQQELPKYYTGNATNRQLTYPNGSKANDDVLAELRHCAGKSSKDVTNCHKSYETDLSQYGRRGQPCCAFVKFRKCLDDTLILPCNKYIDRLIDLYVKEKPTECEKFSYPSFTCIIIVNSNTILVASASALIITFCCGLLYICKCFCRCCKYCCRAKSTSSGKSSNQPSIS